MDNTTEYRCCDGSLTTLAGEPEAVDKYNISALYKFCVYYFNHNLTEENAVDVMNSAYLKNEYELFEQWRMSKAKVVSTHQTWVNSIMKQCDQLKIGLKAYRYMSEGIELAKELGIELDEAELIRTNSTGLTIYNPTNLANMIKGMKNKNQTREAKILARKEYESVN